MNSPPLSRSAEVKLLKFRPNTDKHDYDFKIRAAQKFLSRGDQVRIQMQFKSEESIRFLDGEGLCQVGICLFKGPPRGIGSSIGSCGMYASSIPLAAQEARSSPETQKILDDLADLGRIVSPLKLSNRVMSATLASKKAAASSD